MMHYLKRVLRCCFVLLAFGQLLSAQVTYTDDENTITESKKLLGIAADSLSSYVNNGISYDTLIGNVRITQDSFFMYSDTSFIYNKSDIEAYGNVVILQGDSIEIFSDSLRYVDLIKEAQLFGEIVFKKGDKRLNTTRAIYDINNKRAYYTEGATLINQSQRLISNRGIYDIERDVAYFEGKVSVQDSTSLLQTDSLKYDLSYETVYLISPTNISTDSTNIYCEKGYFNYHTEIGEFFQNLEIKTGKKNILARRVKYDKKKSEYLLTGNPNITDIESYAKADTIVYNEKEEWLDLRGQAYYQNKEQVLRSSRIKYDLKTDEYETYGGSEVVDESGRVLQAELLYRDANNTDVAEKNVVLYDEEEKMKLYSQILLSQNGSDTYKTFNTDGSQPLLIKELTEKNLFLKSDTLSYEKVDSIEQYLGNGNISFLTGDIAGRSRKLKYSLADSTYVFTDRPILWSDSIQITGDTISITFREGQIEAMRVISNAFLAMQNKHSTFDQVKGDFLVCHFQEDTIRTIEVTDNVELVYFMYEEDKLTGVNHSFCGGLEFTFEAGDIDFLRFKDKPNSKFNKGTISDPNSFNLQGFKWEDDKKPNKMSFQRNEF